MTREEAKEILLNSTRKGMEEEGKTENDYCLFSPKKGKCNWTYGEMLEAIREDKNLEDSDCNPIDTYLRYVEWKNNR